MELDSYLSEKQKKKKRSRAYARWGIALVGTYVIITGLAWIIFWSPLFHLKAIVVQGNMVVPTRDVIALMQSSALREHSFWKSLLGAQNIFIWPSSLGPSDLVFLPQVSDIKISKHYFSRTIMVTVTERKPLAIWCITPTTDEQCYWFDATGTIFEKAFDTEGSLMFAIHDYSQPSLLLGARILPEIFVPNFVSIIAAVRASGLNVKEIALKDIGLQEIDLTTYDGPDVYFSLRFLADNDLPVLQNLMTKPGFAKLQYVDFRVENRAYYK